MEVEPTMIGSFFSAALVNTALIAFILLFLANWF